MCSKLPVCAFRQKNRPKWIAAAASGLLLASGVAEAAQINFDDVADGTIINTHYAGVTFTNPIGGNIYARDALGNAPSAPNVASVFATGFPQFNAASGAVDAHFSTPVAVVKIDAAPVAPFEFLTPLTKRPFLQAFDSGNNLLGTVYYAGPLPTNVAQVGPVETLTFASGTTNIAWARFSTQNPAGGVPTYGLFDNLNYDSGSYTLAIHIVGSGSATPTPNQANYIYGAGVSIQANPAAGWTFMGWTGGASGTANPLPVTITSNTDITANFAIVGTNVLTLNAATTGWYDQNGHHTVGNPNYISGFASDSGLFYRDWFIFNIPTSGAPISSAQLKINTYGINSVGGEVTYKLGAVTSSPATVQGSVVDAPSIYADLGGGTIYATRDFLSSQASQTKFIPLNQNLRTALNAAGGTQFVFGGSVLTNINGNTDTGDDIFSFSQGNPGDVQLILTYSNAPVVGYFTDNTVSSTGPNAPITSAGFTPLRIADITTQDLSGLRILMIDESDNNAPSAGLLSRLPAIQSWVAAGGRLVVHDRSAGNVSPNPFLLGTPGLYTARWQADDVEVMHPANTLVTAGPFGLVDNAALDGGCDSTHGYILSTNLPSGARPILRTPIITIVGVDTNAVVAFSYQLGGGFIYYSTIPLDYYLDGGGCGAIGVNAGPLYTPNVLTYMHLLNPALRILPPAQPVAGTFSLYLADVDGSPITADRLPFIMLYSTPNISAPFNTWTTVPNSRVLTGGMLRVDGLSASPSQQYFRAEDIPY